MNKPPRFMAEFYTTESRQLVVCMCIVC